MERRLKSIKIESINSNYYLHLCEHESGERFIEMEQVFNNSITNSIKINPNKLRSIITTLENLESELNIIQRHKDIIEFKNEDEKLIVSLFLKGITIKDLSLTSRIDEKIIKAILVKNEIEIIDGIKIEQPKRFWRKK